VPVPPKWAGQEITLDITARNLTHYVFSAGPASRKSERQIIGYGNGLGLTWGFTGKFLDSHSAKPKLLLPNLYQLTKQVPCLVSMLLRMVEMMSLRPMCPTGSMLVTNRLLAIRDSCLHT